MTTAEGRMASREEREERLITGLTASRAALMIRDMDPHTMEDLISYLGELKAAREANNPKDIEYIVDAIEELFEVDCTDGDETLEEWEERIASSKDGEGVAEARRADHAFFARYQQAKSSAGLKTQRDVARVCGLSVTTVNAIETQRVRPQSGTIQKLASGLQVSVEYLLGG